jgi:hypothetical protein
VGALLGRQTDEFVGAFLVDRLGLQEEAEGRCRAREGGLQPEYVPPGTECDDDAADEGA